jgi:hypothetical protein
VKRPIESDYISQVAYTRALEAYCDRQELIKRAEEAFEASQIKQIGEAHLMQEGFTHCIWSEAAVPVGTKLYIKE